MSCHCCLTPEIRYLFTREGAEAKINLDRAIHRAQEAGV